MVKYRATHVVLVTTALLLLAPASALSTPEPTDDLVSIRDGKMVIEEYNTCRIERPNWAAAQQSPKFQMKVYSEAVDRSIISRDNFVALTTQLVMGVTRELSQHTGMVGTRLRCSTISAPIGTVDLEVNTYMTADGVQLETINTAERRTSRITLSWDDLWAE